MRLTKLKYSGFEEYLFEASDTWYLGERELRYIFKFKNGYGANIFKTDFSCDLFVLSVIKFTDDYNWKLCYDTEITKDDIGYLNNDEVIELLERIKNYEWWTF